MHKIKALLLLLGLCVVALAHAEGLDANKGKREALMMGLYPPDIIMKHQRRLGISDEQRKTISETVRKFQSEISELQWTLQDGQQLLRQSLSGYTINGEQALAQAERVLGLESQFKLAHFRLLIAIKNELTKEQIDKLNQAIGEKLGRKDQ